MFSSYLYIILPFDYHEGLNNRKKPKLSVEIFLKDTIENVYSLSYYHCVLFLHDF